MSGTRKLEYKIDMPVNLLEKQKAKAIKQAKKLLQKEGLLPPDEPVASGSDTLNLTLKKSCLLQAVYLSAQYYGFPLLSFTLNHLA